VKIVRVESVPVRVPIEAALTETVFAGTKREWGRLSRRSPKRPEPMVEYLLVRVVTDEGPTGYGEAPVDIGFFGETLGAVQAAVDDYLGPQLIGSDPLERAVLLDRIDFRGNTCAKSGIDLALHDLAGRAFGVPVSALLGGRFRERVPVAFEVAGDTPERMARMARGWFEQGVRAFKPKVGGLPEADAERLVAMREALGPEVSLRADANQGYSPKEAIRFCRLCEDGRVGLELLEQPVLASDLEGMALVRRSVEVLIEADESCYSPSDALRVIRADAADVLNVKIAKAGGLAASLEVAALARAAGLGVVLGTAFGLGLGIAAKLHLAAALPDLTGAVEFTEIGLHGPQVLPPWDERLSLPLEDGCLSVPDGPGLGVEPAPRLLGG